MVLVPIFALLRIFIKPNWWFRFLCVKLFYFHGNFYTIRRETGFFVLYILFSTSMLPNPVSINISLTEMIQIAIAIVVLISWLLAVLYSIWGGFLLITSGWNEEKVKPAVNHIRHAFLGLIVLILILFVTPKALKLFWLPFADELSPSIIFSKMTDISTRIFNTKSSSDTKLDTLDTTNGLPSDFSDL